LPALNTVPGDIFPDYFPDFQGINAEIGMDELVPHPCNIVPGDGRIA
jgi:hypothetical protein